MTKKNVSIICLAGKNEIAIYGLKLLLKRVDKKNIRILCNANDAGVDTWQPSLLKAARDHDLRIISLEECYNNEKVIFLSLEFDRIVAPKKFSDARLYNIHFSYLPAYKGMFTSALPIKNGEVESGVTLHEIESGIDTGDIIDQIKFRIDEADNARDLYFNYLTHSKELLEKNFDKLLEGEFTTYPQPSKGSSYYSKKAINFKNLEIDLFATAEQIRNQIRAYTFPEFQVPKIANFFVNSAKISMIKSTEKAGTIISVNSLSLSMATIDHDLTIFRDKTFELFESAGINNLKIARDCIENEANINARKGNGWTPIIAAAYSGSEDVLRLLIESGASVNLTDYEGTTPLMYAMSHYENTGRRTVFDLLIENGADLGVADINCKTLKDHAQERNVVGLFNSSE